MGRKEQAYNYLRNAIFTNELLPGEPLNELEIAEKLQMSRSPVREAMRELEVEGLLISYKSRGAFVSSITHNDVVEVFALRALLEPHAFESSFYKITDEELNTIEQASKTAYKMQDLRAYHEADIMLHRLFMDKCGNKRLIKIIDNLNTHIERISRISASYVTYLQESHHEHLNIISAIRQKDLNAGLAALRTHLQMVEQRTLSTLKEVE